jgi:hypothetical protein
MDELLNADYQIAAIFIILYWSAIADILLEEKFISVDRVIKKGEIQF